MTKLEMSGGSDKVNNAVDTPTFVVTGGISPMHSGSRREVGEKGGIQRKHVLLAGTLITVAVLALVGTLVGMYMFTEANKEIIKFTLKFKSSNGEDMEEDVESDPNDNVVMFHVTKPGQDVYVVNDFNKDMQTVRIETKDATNCYVSPLNRSAAMDPSRITGSGSMTGTEGNDDQTYVLSNTPVKDRSFLTKKAADLCKTVSLYWAYTSCNGLPADSDKNSTDLLARDRRAIYRMHPYMGLPGLGGCCNAYWACRVTMTERVEGEWLRCTTYYQTGTCCGSVAKPYCLNLYHARWQTPGLNC